MSKNLLIDFPGLHIYYGKIETRFDGSTVCSHQLPKEIISNPQCSNFYHLFRSILTCLDQYLWFFEEDSFDLNPINDPEIIRLTAELDNYVIEPLGYLVDQSGFFVNNSCYIIDDWNYIFGIKKPVIALDDLVTLYQQNKFDSDFLAKVNIIFVNNDGAYWAIYTDHTYLITQIKQNLSQFDKDDYEFKIKFLDISWQENLVNVSLG